MPLFKTLYVASNVDELQKKATVDLGPFSSKETSKVCKSAEKLLFEADRMFKERDEEKAFVLYMKFLEFLIHLGKRADFATCTEYKHLKDKGDPIFAKVSKLKDSLATRYKALNEANELQSYEGHKQLIQEESEKDTADIKKVIKENKSVQDGAVNNAQPNVINGAPPENTITASELFSLMNDHKNILLIDTRPSSDFKESHIKYSCCINVPQEILIPGTTSKRLEIMMPESSLQKWSKRNSVDYVVLFDWNTSVSTLPFNHPLHVLEEAMCKWDVVSPLSKPLRLLCGGYKEWLLRYPMYTTKALNVLAMEETTIPAAVDVSGIEYPDLDTMSNKSSSEKHDRTATKSLESNKHNSTLVNGWVNESLQDKKLLNNTVIHNKLDEHVSSGIDKRYQSAKLFEPRRQSFDEGRDSPFKTVPKIDRGLKPDIKPEKSNSDTSVSNKQENNDLVIQNLLKEKELEVLRLRRELEAEGVMKAEIQKREEILLEQIKQLKIAEEETKSSRATEKPVEKLPQERSPEQIRKEKELRTADLERLRKQKPSEQSVKSNKSEHFTPTRQDSVPTVKDKGKATNNEEYTVPLKKSDGSSRGGASGLVRSYSSPDIAQLIQDENKNVCIKRMPDVDRSLKPKPDHKFTSSTESQLRSRDLNPIYGNIGGRPLTGLRNLGNTCYMNSIIQCLSNTKTLANYFTDDHYRQHIKRNSKQGSNGEIADEFAVVLSALWSRHYKSISPKDFKNTASKYIPMCAGSEQQDAHEFLVVLMDKLHWDLNQGRAIDPLPDLDSVPQAVDKFWNHHKTKNFSKISDTFEGLIKSTLSCLSCSKKSDSFEVFSCLPLPILSSKCSLNQCITSYLDPEKISGEGAWHCPACKQKKEAEKAVKFWQLPRILIIQLKRFSYDGMWRRKLQSHVDFHSRLDFPYRHNDSRKYDLYAVVNHLGYLEGGHYTACCKNPASGKWYKYDDTEVSEISSREIFTPAAYLLFYSAVDYG